MTQLMCNGERGTHPKVMAMMKAYLEKKPGPVLVRGLCAEAGFKPLTLPQVNSRGACCCRLLGRCGRKDCTCRAVPEEAITKEWADLTVKHSDRQ